MNERSTWAHVAEIEVLIVIPQWCCTLRSYDYLLDNAAFLMFNVVELVSFGG